MTYSFTLIWERKAGIDKIKEKWAILAWKVDPQRLKMGDMMYSPLAFDGS
jgi:hypothetical protein